MQEARHRVFHCLPDDAVPRRLQDLHGQHRRQRLPRRQKRQGRSQISRTAALLQHAIPGEQPQISIYLFDHFFPGTTNYFEFELTASLEMVSLT